MWTPSSSDSKSHYEWEVSKFLSTPSEHRHPSPGENEPAMGYSKLKKVTLFLDLARLIGRKTCGPEKHGQL